jgi:heme-degrading monooxygenase HmoA
MPFTSITRLRLRSPIYLPSFMLHAMRSGKQVQKAPGFLKGKTLLDKHLTFWTMTLWNEEASMKAYRIADAHKMAMPKLLNWCDEASIVHWFQNEETFPEWINAYERMKKEGRISKVRHPSPHHATMDIPPPRYPSRTERILFPNT